MDNPYADLEALRAAAHIRDWGELQAALTRLLLQLDFYAGLEMAVQRVHAHLPVFERAHPEAVWARQLLVSLVAYGVAPHELPPEASQPHASPGAANFILAVFDLCRAVERRTPPDNRIRFVVSAVANAILADLAAFWYSAHPHLWERQQAAGDQLDPDTGLTVRQQIYTQFWLDEAVAARDTAAWLAVAARVAEKLR